MEQHVLRVRLEVDEDFDILNGYLRDGWKIIQQSEVAQRTLRPVGEDPQNDQIHFSLIVYTLEKK